MLRFARMARRAPHSASVMPPFTGYVCPVIQLLAFDARNSAMLATSSGWPRAPAFALPPSLFELRRGESSYGAARRMMGFRLGSSGYGATSRAREEEPPPTSSPTPDYL